MQNDAPMTTESLLFPVWKTVKSARSLPPYYTRLLWLSDKSNRSLVAYLTNSLDKATLVIVWEESGERVVPVFEKETEGVSTLGRAMQWAEWIISDFEADSRPRRRASKKAQTGKLERAVA